MSKLHLTQRIGHRYVSTKQFENESIHGPFELIVFGGRNAEKIAYQDVQIPTEEQAIRRHSEVVEDVRQNPEKYRIGNLF